MIELYLLSVGIGVMAVYLASALPPESARGRVLAVDPSGSTLPVVLLLP